MNIKNVSILFFMFLFSYSFSQLIPSAEIRFNNFTAYAKEGSAIFGKEIRKAQANTYVNTFGDNDDTWIEFKSSVIGDSKQNFKITNVIKKTTNSFTIYEVESYNIMEPKTPKTVIKFSFFYSESNLKRVIFITNNYAFEFY